MGYVLLVSEIIGIHAASLRYTEQDTVELQNELGSRCAVPLEVLNANLSRRAEWFAARALVMRVLDHLNLGAFLQMNSAFGYPELYFLSGGGPTPYVVSWSHTSDFIVVVGSENAIGVDVEKMNRRVEPVLERITTPDELERFSSAGLVLDGVPVSPAVALWCAKEAVAKASGLGMRWGLKNFELLAREGETWPVKMRQPGPRALQDPAVRFWRRDGFLMAVCAERTLLLKPLHWV